MFFFNPNSNYFTQEYEIENELFRLLSFKFLLMIPFSSTRRSFRINHNLKLFLVE